MNDKKTYGEIIKEHSLKNLTLEDDVIEYRKQMEPDVLKKIYAAAAQAKHHPAYSGKDFYISLHWIIERLGQGFKPLPIARRSCPTPVYKQTVWKYRTDSDDLELLWTIPTQETYYGILRNQIHYLSDPETQFSAQCVILMESGELLKWVKKENGNKPDGVIKINQQTNEEQLCLMK